MKTFMLIVSKPIFIDAETSKEAIIKFHKDRKDSLEEVLDIEEWKNE